MSHSPEMDAHLARNRQRRAIEELRARAASVLPPDVKFADAVASHSLQLRIREIFARRRPAADGELLVTRQRDKLVEATRQYFAAHRQQVFNVFLTQWSEAGALLLSGYQLEARAYQLLCIDGDGVYGCEVEGTAVFSLDRTVEQWFETFELFHRNASE